MKVNLRKLYDVLFKEMGSQGWWPADTKHEIVLGAIMVQNTSWRNVEPALENLWNETEFNPEKIHSLSTEKLESLVRSSGFYRNKTRTIQSFFEWLKTNDWNYDRAYVKNKNTLRQELLNIKGIGLETADVLRLYVFDQKVFIADEYARRLFNWLEETEYKTYQQLYNSISLAKDFTLYEAQEFHGLIDEFGKLYLGKKSVKENFIRAEILQ